MENRAEVWRRCIASLFCAGFVQGGFKMTVVAFLDKGLFGPNVDSDLWTTFSRLRAHEEDGVYLYDVMRMTSIGCC